MAKILLISFICSGLLFFLLRLNLWRNNAISVNVLFPSENNSKAFLIAFNFSDSTSIPLVFGLLIYPSGALPG
ncbi:MAG: hypothetical protein A3A77_02670 [Candidatus Blackburnbacteria bacterium RIFCSPLOWO2_01_FULL_40_20]|uniref:Uncharacterized protein n=1 Tax=Candidatus Blackburnbacteria bacterium RIFCSPLOWO2_01_FULL_40_20 TaxID=1797519 RepID=A0A1G1VDB2_9BACT|nr:MAG: hypothetical protein A3A77_02670 [Candidatus Blackburnbacteria bacterium RIFCSPLOWO2_01_FULL_40_20]